MIIYTKYYDISRQPNALAKVLGYVKSKTKDTPGEYRGLFWASGVKVRFENLARMEEQFRHSGLVRMIVFAPVRWLEPEDLEWMTRETMWKFLKAKRYYSTYFVYGLHYNTDHPHSHVILTSYHGVESIFGKTELIKLERAARKVFGEPIGAGALRQGEWKRVDEQRVHLEETRIETEIKGEDKDVEKMNMESIRDVFEMEV